MKSSKSLIAGLALATFVFATPAGAQDSGSMQVGNATVTVGAGTALLTLPDVPSLVKFHQSSSPFSFLNGFDQFGDFGAKIGWNVNGSLEVPTGAAHWLAINGFWADIEDDDTVTCTRSATATCSLASLVDNPGVFQTSNTFQTGQRLLAEGERNVANWGASIESKWQLAPGVMGVTRAPHRRTFAIGGEIRGIDQDIDVDYRFENPVVVGAGIEYDEDLETRYYGAYAAWGGDYTPVLFAGLWNRLGLQSSFLLRGGIYRAETEYSGRLRNRTGNLNSAVTLSDDEIAFIGGLVLETKKRIGRRAALSLKSEYEYYSYVPEMAYNQVDIAGANVFAGGAQVGTQLGDDDAFSMRTSLRLTIKLGPSELYQ
ncbi:MAG: hypothetical protein VX871_08710 [Pseudomonadota bacterium]|nr:hypothetical protein [Pseudomonadota bacterium]